MNKNLLEDWYKEAYIMSSPINITPTINREAVNFMYNSLLSFFSKEYFDIQIGTDRPIEKTSWIYSILANNHHIGSMEALHEICMLLKYASTLDEDIQKELKSLVRNPQNLRTFFFELYTYRFLDENNIENKKKVKSGNQIIEGTCVLNNKEFLFECRQIFLPNIAALDILRRIMTYIFNALNKNTKGFGMICTIELNKPVIGKHSPNFESKVKTFFEGLNKLEKLNTIDYTHQDDFGVFKVINYDEATMIELQHSKTYDIMFYLQPPRTITPGVNNHYSANIVSNFSVNQSKIYEKLETVLKEKKRQHADSEYPNKVIFILSETIREFHMGLFQNNMGFDANEIKRVYDKVGIDAIVCIIRKDFFSDVPKISVLGLYPQKFEKEANQLLNFFSRIGHPTIKSSNGILYL